MRAIISVDDKTGVVAFAQGLSALNVEIYSTGNTAHALAEASLPVHSITEITGFPEILDGRVKTLHPAVHGGILARRDRDTHMAELEEHHITPIDLVVCNLYPFQNRRAARCDARDRRWKRSMSAGSRCYARPPRTSRRSRSSSGRRTTISSSKRSRRRAVASAETRRKLAAIAFQHTAIYDTAIAEYLRRGTSDELFPEKLTLGLRG